MLVGAVRGVEARLLPTRDFRFHLLPSEPIYRRTWWKNVALAALAGRLLREVGRVFAAERPVGRAGDRRLRLGAGGLVGRAARRSRPRSRSRTPIPGSPPAG